MPRLGFWPLQKTVEIRAGSLLLRAIVEAGLPIGRACEGRGICGSCRVWVISGELTGPTEDECETCERLGFTTGERLACRARVEEEVTIYCPAWGPRY